MLSYSSMCMELRLYSSSLIVVLIFKLSSGTDVLVPLRCEQRAAAQVPLLVHFGHCHCPDERHYYHYYYY